MSSRHLALALLAALAVGAAVARAAAAPAVPQWPNKYFATGIFSIPYGNLAMPFETDYDASAGRQRFGYYNGLDVMYSFTQGGNTEYEIVPRVETRICRNVSGQAALVDVLPDLTGWTFIGYERQNGWMAQHWQWKTLNFTRTSINDFWLVDDVVTGFARPLRLEMHGIDWLYGSHPDTYILDYTGYVPDWNAPAAFELPRLCASGEAHVVALTDASHEMLHMRSSWLRAMAAPFAPHAPRDLEEKLFHLHMDTHGRRFSTPEEYARRFAAFRTNHATVEAHNARFRQGLETYTMKLNHFADFEPQEWARLVLPRSLRKDRAAGSRDHVADDLSVDVSALPSSLDWRSAGAVGPVRDQGICGSCWAFGTVGSIAGFAAVASNGRWEMLAPQQLVDCAWVDGNPLTTADLGCDGGFAGSAMGWVTQNSGIALEEDYTYMMMDTTCDSSVRSSNIRLTGYVNVTSGSEAALMQALTLGPVAVAIDAAASGFAFYESGVWSSPECKNDVASLDHEVLAIGWGTDASGAEYYIVQNSWSPHWGENGFFRLARNKSNMCGIASQATYPIIA